MSNRVSMTNAERALADTLVERWNDHQRRFAPLTTRYANMAQRSDAQHGQATRGASDTAWATASQQMPDLSNNLFAGGATPGSGRFASATGQMHTQTGRAAGLGAMQARLGSEQQHLSGLQNVARIGQQQAQGALSGMQQDAGRAAQGEQMRANNANTMLNMRRSQKGMQLGMGAAQNIYGGGN